MDTSIDKYGKVVERSGILKLAVGSLLLPIIIVVTTVIVFPPHWMTIDDLSMNLILAGFYGSPDEHVRCMHPVIGLILKYLYSTNQTLPWYALFHLALISFGLSLVLLSLLLTFRVEESMALFAVVVFVDIAFLSGIQYTSTAFLLAQGALALLLASTKNDFKGKSGTLLVLSGLAFVVSFMVRWRVAEISLLIATAFILLLHNMKTRQRTKLAIVTIATSFALGELVHYGFVTYYENNPEWKGFFRWHENVNHFADFDHVRPERSALLNARWSANDLAMMKNFLFLDASVFNNQAAETLLSKSKTAARANLSGDYIGKELNRVLLDPRSLVSLAAFSLTNFALFRKSNDWFFNIIFLYSVLAIDGILICLFKAPQYIFIPLFGFPLVATILRAPKGFLAPVKRRIAFLTMTFILASSALVIQQDDARRSKNRRIMLIREIHNIHPTAKEFYVILPFSLPLTNLSPFDNLSDILKGFNFDFSSRIYPLKKRVICGYGATDFLSVIGNPSSKFAASDYIDSINQIVSFSAEHYRLKVKFKQIYHSDELHYGIYEPHVEGRID